MKVMCVRDSTGARPVTSRPWDSLWNLCGLRVLGICYCTLNAPVVSLR